MYWIEDRSIVFKNGLRHTFDDFIAEAIPFTDTIVVRLENQGWKRSNENIFAVDFKGNIVWRIEPRVHAFSESHYVNIYQRNDLLDAYNWDGTILSIDPKTGEVVAESSAYSLSKRQVHKRQLI